MLVQVCRVTGRHTYAHIFYILPSHHRIAARAFSYTTEHLTLGPYPMYIYYITWRTKRHWVKRKCNKIKHKINFVHQRASAARQFRIRAHTNHRNYNVICVYYSVSGRLDYWCICRCMFGCLTEEINQIHIQITSQRLYKANDLYCNNVMIDRMLRQYKLFVQPKTSHVTKHT